MADDRYSVYFTGHLLAPLNDDEIDARLAHLFPHAPADTITALKRRQRVRLTHGEPLDEARQIAQVLGAQDFDTEIELESDTAPRPVPAPPRLRPARLVAIAHPTPSTAEPTPRPADEHHEGQDDELTPRGKRWFWFVAGTLSLATAVAIWAALHQQRDRLPVGSDGGELPALCVADTRTTPLGRVVAHALHCAAASRAGRYRLMFRCPAERNAGADGLTLDLGFFELDGAPRMPDWQPRDAATAGRLAQQQFAGSDFPYELTLRYARPGLAPRPARLLALQQENAGRLDLPPAEIARLLDAPSIGFAGAFGDETVRFDLAAASWYVDVFRNACGLPSN